MEKSAEAYRTISEVADMLDVQQHVLRFWESKFTAIKPLKRSGNRRYYRPEDIDVLKAIKHLLYSQGLTIRGAQKLFREKGTRAAVASVLDGGAIIVPAAGEKRSGRGTETAHAPAAPEKMAALKMAALKMADSSWPERERLVAELSAIRDRLRAL